MSNKNTNNCEDLAKIFVDSYIDILNKYGDLNYEFKNEFFVVSQVHNLYNLIMKNTIKEEFKSNPTEFYKQYEIFVKDAIEPLINNNSNQKNDIDKIKVNILNNFNIYKKWCS